MAFYTSLLCALFLFACQTIPPVKETTFNRLSGWESDSHLAALNTFKESCKKILPKHDHSWMGNEPQFGKVIQWKQLCNKASKIYNQFEAKAFFENSFVPYKVTTADRLFTGYYEIALKGSIQRTKRYNYPLYKRPADLDKKKPYYTRKEIDEGALEGRGLVLAWVESPIDAFFLHIQGSGRLLFENGAQMRVQFAGRNNHPYFSIGKYLLRENILKEVTAPSLKQWLHENPDRMYKVLHQNPSYIFFKVSRTTDVVGGQGSVLTAERSIAIDHDIYPYGIPFWVHTTYPSSKPLRKLMVAQDTGSAIKGRNRADIFFGYGKEAENFAGHMKQAGFLVMLLPRSEG